MRQDRPMSQVVFTGECWIADAGTRPDLDESGFGAGWNHIGHVNRGEEDLWRHFAKTARKRSAEFYISVLQKDLTELPARFWLGVEWLTGQLYVATKPAVPRKLARREPDTHPGLLHRPARYLSARITAAEGSPLFERLR